MSYPTTLDVAGFFVDAGLISEIPTDETEISQLLAATIAQWDKQTGWNPYYRSNQNATNVAFWVNSGQSVYMLPTKIESMVEPKAALGSESGELTFGRHWRWLNPSRRSEVELLVPLVDGEQVTLFDVVQMRVLTVGDDVKAAILAGCAVAYCENHPAAAANLISQRLGEVQVQRSAEEGSAVKQWRDRWNRTVRHHRRGMVVY